jgi:regulation of enolase protein 1 (concanavalin A-like superfamily)
LRSAAPCEASAAVRFLATKLRNPLASEAPRVNSEPMKSTCALLFAWSFAAAGIGLADQVLFKDSFHGRLQDGWSWVRENPEGWRVTQRGLEIRVEPGNMWGPANDAKNILVRSLPEPPDEGWVITVKVQNHPTEQYEQVNLVWYYDDGHMVKLGQEQVDGELTIVMGREENDRARTIAIIPLETESVWLRYRVRGNLIRGEFRPANSEEWKEAGECDLPVKGPPKISLQAYQGPAGVERWARITDFEIRRGEPVHGNVDQ